MGGDHQNEQIIKKRLFSNTYINDEKKQMSIKMIILRRKVSADFLV